MAFVDSCCLTGEGGCFQHDWVSSSLIIFLLKQSHCVFQPAFNSQCGFYSRLGWNSLCGSALSWTAPSPASASTSVGCEACSITLDHSVALVCIFLMAEDANVICTYWPFVLPRTISLARLPIYWRDRLFLWSLILLDRHIFWTLIPCEMNSWQVAMSVLHAASSPWWLFQLLCRGLCFMKSHFTNSSCFPELFRKPLPRIVSWSVPTVFPSCRFKFSGLIRSPLIHFELIFFIGCGGLKWEMFPP